MSCDIANGRLEPCKDSVGGINAVYFVNYGDITSVTYDLTETDVVESVGGTPSAYKFDVRGSSTYTENIQSSRENGTTMFEQVLELSLKKLSKEDHKTIKLLSFGRPQVIIEDNNGNAFIAGIQHGADVTGGTIVTGGAMGDMSGYTLSFTGMEKAPANFIDVALAGNTAEANITAAGFVVVEGV
jgi:hypothetical protein